MIKSAGRFRILQLFFAPLLACSNLIGAEDEPMVKVTVKPEPAYIERRDGAQSVNFDFALENLSASPLVLSRIEVSASDKSDKLIARKFLDGNGSSPNILTIPNREIPSHGAVLVFNPFPQFDQRMVLASLRYDFTFRGKGDKPVTTEAQLTVRPINYNTKTGLILPLQKRLMVYDGHDFYAHHRRFDLLNPFLQQAGFSANCMRYAYDLCLVNDKGEMNNGPESKNESWYGFGADIHAPGDGKIAALFDGMPDNRNFNEKDLATRPLVIFGNYVVIDHLNGEFSLLAHARQGSVRPKIGQAVKQGEVIAQVGASGSANFPHLHYELQTGLDVKSEGLPSYFRSFRRVLGEHSVDVPLGQIDTGDIIESQ
ncbi:MAG: M23 family metallopeptidase [Vicinamibacterales bacterium]